VDDTCELSLIIPTCPNRTAKLRTLLDGIAATKSDHDRFEVIVAVDDLDDTPLDVLSALPSSIARTGLTQSHTGPAGARNHAIRHARGGWVLFFDDDAIVDAGTIPGHLQRIRHDPAARTAFLGRVDWPAEQIRSPWGQLLAGTSMIFFARRMQPGGAYPFRHFCTSNLSVRRDWVREVGGFDDGFPYALHEDIELGWRLERALGMQVRYEPEIRSWHDHEILPRAYFQREHQAGHVARLAKQLNRAFHDEVWGWLVDPVQTLDTLSGLFGRTGRQLYAMLERWSEPSDERVSPDSLEAVYLAHLPLKRMAFCAGYADRPFNEFWESF
jgi:GT2 family glycosyltransferase